MISILIEGNILKIVVHVVPLQGLLTAVKLRIVVACCYFIPILCTLQILVYFQFSFVQIQFSTSYNSIIKV